MPDQIAHVTTSFESNLTKFQLVQAVVSSEIFPKAIFIEGDKVIIALGAVMETSPNSFIEAERFITSMKNQHSSASNQLRFFCTFPFEFSHSGVVWKDMPKSHVFLPRKIIEWERGRVTSTELKSNEGKLEIASTLEISGKKTLLQPFDVPTEMDWEVSVEKALKDIEKGDFEKVVLARVKQLKLTSKQKVDFGKTLISMHEEYPNCVTFLIALNKDQVFFGATPEILGKRSGTEFHTMALAGTVPISEGKEVASSLLMSSEKLRDEHRIVVETITEGLKKFMTEIKINETEILQLQNVFHLHTPIMAKIKPETSWRELVESLHPTPAVGGRPKEIAKQQILRTETWGRGWYTGIFGWVDEASNFDFRVALRCALLNQKEVWLFAGAGIVKGSDPKKEWEETESKFLPVLKSLEIVEEEH